MKLTYKEWNEIIVLLKSELRDTEKSLKSQKEIVNTLDKLLSQAQNAENWKEYDDIKVSYDMEYDTKRHYSKRYYLLSALIDKLENQEI